MFTRIAVALFALYCVHGSQNTARDTAALAEQGSTLVREVSAQAPKAALGFCLENEALCRKALGTSDPQEATAPTRKAEATPAPVVVEHYPLPPRRPAAHKKA